MECDPLNPPFPARTMRRVTWRLIPFMMLLYFVAFLDRVNVGFAALTMNVDLGISDTLFGLASGAFFLGYFLFEVPSNLMLERFGARRWISRIMISWGIVTMLMATVKGPLSYVGLRVILGIAEAGFFPGMILYMTYWFPSPIRARMIALFVAAIPVSSVLGLPVSGQIMKLEGIWGLHGWQWLFLLEGLPAVVLGILVPFCLTDRPRDARWLAGPQRQWLEETLEGESRHKPHMPLRQALLHPSILLLSAVYFCMMMGLYGLSFWMPKVLKSFGTLTDTQISLIGIIPYACGVATMFFWGLHSDRSGEREWHAGAAMLSGACGFLAVALAHNWEIAVAGFSFVSIGSFCAMPAFWPLPSARLRGTAAAGGIAVVNSVGNLGGFVGPYVIGFIKDTRLGFTGGLCFTAVFLVAGALLLVRTRRPPTAS